MTPARKGISKRKIGALALLLVWALNPITGQLLIYLEHAHAHSEVAATEIQSEGQSQLICEHHLQGCPKDCFCPKIDRSKLGEMPMDDVVQGPAWDKCASESSKAPLPSLAGFLPGPGLEAPAILESSEHPALPRASPPVDPFRFPLLKIPIA